MQLQQVDKAPTEVGAQHDHGCVAHIVGRGHLSGWWPHGDVIARQHCMNAWAAAVARVAKLTGQCTILQHLCAACHGPRVQRQCHWT